MPDCTISYNLLDKAAKYYSTLGYQIGVAQGKELLEDNYRRARYVDWDNISIVLNGIVCVDFDRFVNLDEYVLPPTLKERSPRGLHFLYQLPYGFRGTTKIGWKDKVDLLTIDDKSSPYGPYKDFKGHVLCSPSKGYTRLYPRNLPAKANLPMAPEWVCAAMESD